MWHSWDFIVAACSVMILCSSHVLPLIRHVNYCNLLHLMPSLPWQSTLRVQFVAIRAQRWEIMVFIVLLAASHGID